MSAVLASPLGDDVSTPDFRAMSRDQRRAFVAAYGLPRGGPGRARWLVAPILGPLIERLSRGELGWCNASAPALRVMAFVDTGHVYGERSIPRFIGRQVKAGKLRHKRIPPGSYFCRTKRWTRNGTQMNRYESEAERRERLWREKTARRKQRRDRARLFERDRQERAQRERQSRRQQREAETIVRVLSPVAAPSVRADAQAAIAGVLAALGKPAAVAMTPAPSRTESSASGRRDRAAEVERARVWARHHEDGEPDPADE